MKIVLFNFLFIFIFLSCQEQEIVNSVKAEYGELNDTVKTDLSFVDNLVPTEEYDQTKQLTFTNNGGFAIKKFKISGFEDPINYSGDEQIFPGENGTCKTEILSGESCIVELKISSRVEIIKKMVIVISYNDGVRDLVKKIPLDVSVLTKAKLLYGIGEYTNLDELNSNFITPVRFKKARLGETTKSLITLGNFGRRSLSIKELEVVGTKYNFTGNGFPGENGTCGKLIAPMKMCTIEMFYRPSIVENINVEVPVSFHNGVEEIDSKLLINLESTDERANLTFSISGNYDFGDVVQTNNQTIDFLIFNNTVAAANDFTITFDNPNVVFTGGVYPGINGDCDEEIEPYTFCKVELEYNAANLGSTSTVLNINYNDNNFYTPQYKDASITFSADIVPAADFSVDAALSSNGTGDFGVIEAGKAGIHGIAFRNTGGFLGEIESIEIVNDISNTFKVVAGGSCGTTIRHVETNKFCSISVRALNSIVGSYNADLRIHHTTGAGGSTFKDFPLKAIYSDTSDVTFTGNLNFGTLPYPSTLTRDRTYTLTNNKQGVANLTLDTTFLPGSEFSIVGNTCGSTLNQNQSCDITVRFDPVNTGGESIFFDVDVVDDLKSYKLRFSLTGEARSHANLRFENSASVVVSSIDFEVVEVGQTKEMFMFLRNVGGYSAGSISSSVTGSDFAVDEVTCSNLNSMTLSGAGGTGQFCVFKILFTPSSSGAKLETLNINYTNGENPVVSTLTLNGTGGSVGVLAVQSPQSTYSFGGVVIGDTATQTITVENTGSRDINNIVLIPGDSVFDWDGVSSTCSGTLTVGSTCDLVFNFSPGDSSTTRDFLFYTYDSEGMTYENFLKVNGSGLKPPDVVLSVQGSGLVPSYEFGDSPKGQQAYVKVIVSNNGQAPAENLTAVVSGDSEYSFTALTCSNGASLSSSSTCEFYMIYDPTDTVYNTGTFTVSFDNHSSKSLILKGTGVEPSAQFERWNQIYAFSGDTSGELKLKWDPAIVSAGVNVTGYKVYEHSAPLPSDVASLAGYEVKDITSLNTYDYTYNRSGLVPGSITYITVRPKYSGGVIEVNEDVAHLKIIIPPKNMALVHPFMVNSEFCENMSLTPDKTKNFGCTYSGIGNKQGNFDFNQFLFVDRYEISDDGNGGYETKAGGTPFEFSNVINANQACTNVSESIGGVSLNKSLMRRSEFVASAAWDPLLSPTDIDVFESGGAENCSVNSDVSEPTGSRDFCVSKYGIFDLVGNLWEWNSDIVESKFGSRSTIDAGNEELFGFHLGNLLPGESQNQDCFNFVFGLPQVSLGECSNGPTASSVSDILGDNYFWPPLVDSQRSIRSGGGVGPSSQQNSREAGRWVVDINQEVLSNIAFTGARCVIRAPFSTN